MPYIHAVLCGEAGGRGPKGMDFDRRLYVARRVFEQSSEDTYVASLSSRTIVYKGMFLVGQLRPVLRRTCRIRTIAAAIAMVHSRFSTNTNPSWERAHPNRLILHNGEINTIRGNADRMLAREETMSLPVIWQTTCDKVLPVVNGGSGSDSAMLDNTLEFSDHERHGPAPGGDDHHPGALEARTGTCMPRTSGISTSYYATMMEPWDGPASILFSDGDVVGAVLDRNGLRPSRYYITDDGS